jgi:hypothetical protein
LHIWKAHRRSLIPSSDKSLRSVQSKNRNFKPS